MKNDLASRFSSYTKQNPICRGYKKINPRGKRLGGFAERSVGLGGFQRGFI
ncbi:hypothetical protein HMPREF1521_1358 [Veillonella sp. AS16]|nr:hypothetical protein HMPREF1521_1358 [Veillonella sp. AS16]